jgi:hypothetical protein
MIKSSVLLSQENFFGSTAKEVSEQPSLPVTVPDKGAGKLPVFKYKYYKKEKYLQPRPKQVEADANSL